jgi:hypothetical protein
VISGASPVGVAENGTLVGEASLLVMCLVFSNLPSYLPSLATGLVPAGHHYYEGSEFCQPPQRISPTTVVSFSHRPGRWSEEPGTGITRRSSSRLLTINSQRSDIWQTSLLISIELLNIPSPITLLPFRHARFKTLPGSFIVAAATPTTEGYSVELIRSSSSRCVRSKVRAMLAHSPTGLAESSSLTLRTVLSPQVALHPSSRKRSYHCRLQGGNDTLDGTLTQLFNRLHRRTSPWRQPGVEDSLHRLSRVAATATCPASICCRRFAALRIVGSNSLGLRPRLVRL